MGFYFHCQDVALDSVGHFFRVGQEGAGPLASLEDEKPAQCPMPSSRMCKSHPKMNGIKLWTIRKLHSPGEEPEPGPCGPSCLGFGPHRPPSLWLPREALSVGAADTHQVDYNYLISPISPPQQAAGVVEDRGKVGSWANSWNSSSRWQPPD